MAYWRTAMTHRRISDAGWASRGGAAAAVTLFALLLGGCATGHIGSEWPCPVNQGTPCRNVSAADPAGAGARQSTGARQNAGARQIAGAAKVDEGSPGSESRHRYRAAGRVAPGESTRHDRCPRGCRPFAWLRGLWSTDSEDGSEPLAGDLPETIPVAGAVPDGNATGLSPADMPAAGVPRAGLPPAGARTAEAIGRIWIAPYVDVRGVYHEARWVRVVVEPARWRLP